MAVVLLINWDFLCLEGRSVRPKLKSQPRAPSGTADSGFLFGMVAQALQCALEPLACGWFRQAQLLASFGLGVAVNDDAQDQVCVHTNQAGQFGQQLLGVQLRIGKLENAAMQVAIEFVLHALATGFSIVRTKHIARVPLTFFSASFVPTVRGELVEP